MRASTTSALTEADPIMNSGLSFTRLFTGMSASQTLFLINLVTDFKTETIPTPLSTFFSILPTPLIPFSTLFTLLYIGLQGLDVWSLSSSSYNELATMNKSGYIVPPTALYLVAPIISLLMDRDLPQTLWWLEPAIVTGLVMLMQNWMRATAEGVNGLEDLKYSAKGA